MPTEKVIQWATSDIRLVERERLSYIPAALVLNLAL